MQFVSAVIVAGGTGSRMNLGFPKQFYRLAMGKTVLYYAVKPFCDAEIINEIIVVTLKEYIDFCKDELKELNKVKKIIAGGDNRQQSVYEGLLSVDERCTVVVIHDGARPFVTGKEIYAAAAQCFEGNAAVVGVNTTDTIKIVNDTGFVENTPDRKYLWAAQTPQAIPYGIFVSAFTKAEKERFDATDDVSLAELAGCPVKVIEGSYDNIKITTEKDIILAKDIFKRRFSQGDIIT